MSRDSNLSQTLGIDLIQAAKNELEFLKLVDDNPNLCKGSLVKNAIRRYELHLLQDFAHRQPSKQLHWTSHGSGMSTCWLHFITSRTASILYPQC